MRNRPVSTKGAARREENRRDWRRRELAARTALIAPATWESVRIDYVPLLPPAVQVRIRARHVLPLVLSAAKSREYASIDEAVADVRARGWRGEIVTWSLGSRERIVPAVD